MGADAGFGAGDVDESARGEPARCHRLGGERGEASGEETPGGLRTLGFASLRGG